MLMIRQGRYEEAARLTGEGVELAGGDTNWIGPLFKAVEDPAARDEALAIVGEAFANTPLDPRLEIVARVLLDDIDGAMIVAMSLAEASKFYEMDVLFLHELRPVREHPDFMLLAQRLNILGYWQASNCEWQDDKVRCHDD
jgi:hypothetical protein